MCVCVCGGGGGGENERGACISNLSDFLGHIFFNFSMWPSIS